MVGAEGQEELSDRARAAAAAAELLQQASTDLEQAEQRLQASRPVHVRLRLLGKQVDQAQDKCDAAEKELEERKKREEAAALARDQAAAAVEEQQQAVAESRKRVEDMREEQA